MRDPDIPREVEVVGRIQESPTIFSLDLQFTAAAPRERYAFVPGQFNMLYLYGIGEIPVSVVSDPDDPHLVRHTIRTVGRVTRALGGLPVGSRLGLRGPFGRGWPVKEAEGRDLLLLTGGLGCAPLVGVIHYVMRRREQFGHVAILQGVKHGDDLIWREQYQAWSRVPDTEVHLAADVPSAGWQWHVGLVTELLDEVRLDWDRTVVMVCGPEPMMVASTRDLVRRGVPASAIWLSMERNMHCAVGLCGHCQYGADFVCRDGPVFNLPRIGDRLGARGI